MGFSAAYSGKTYRQYVSDHRVLCECDLRCAEDFRLDILSAISDPMREAESFGAEVLLPEDGVPYSPAPLIADLSQIRRLKAAAPENSPRTLDRLKSVEYFKTIGKDYCIGGWVEGAFAECCDLRGIDRFLMDIALEEPEVIHEFLEKTCEQAIRFALLQIRAGADIIGIGDAAASLISPAMFEEFAFPYQKRIVEAVHRRRAYQTAYLRQYERGTAADDRNGQRYPRFRLDGRYRKRKTPFAGQDDNPVRKLRPRSGALAGIARKDRAQSKRMRRRRRKLLLIFGRLRSSARYARGKSARRCGRARRKDAKRIKKRYPKFRISFSFTIQSVLFYATEDSSKGSAPTQEE